MAEIYNSQMTMLASMIRIRRSLAERARQDAKLYEQDPDHYYYLSNAAELAVKCDGMVDDYQRQLDELIACAPGRITTDGSFYYVVTNEV